MSTDERDRFMLAVTITLVYSFAIMLLGVTLLRITGFRETEKNGLMTYMATAFMLGTAVQAVLWMMIALSGQLSDFIIKSVLAISLIANFYMCRSWIRNLASSTTVWIKELINSELTIIFSVFVIATILFLLALAAWFRPPLGDAEAFYMVYPKVIAASERLEILKGYEGFSQIGLLAELHFAALFSISGQNAAKLFVWFVVLAVMTLLHGIMTVSGIDRKGKLFGILILLSSTAFINHASDGKVDLFAAAFGLAAFYQVLFIQSGQTNRRVIVLAGLFSGFAIVSKFSYLPSLVPALFALVYMRTRDTEKNQDKRRITSLKEAFLVMIAISVMISLTMSPHFIKNGILFNAPLAPFLGNATWTNQTWYSPQDTAWILITYPLALVFGRYPMQGGNLSFMLIVFLPLIIVLAKKGVLKKNIASQLALSAIVGTVFWMLLRPSVFAPRYILAVLLMFIPIVAYAASWLFNHENFPKLLSMAVLTCLSTALFFTYFSYRHYPGSLYRSVTGKHEQCALASPYCEPLLKLNALADRGDRVFFASYYSYWLRNDLLQCRSGSEDVLAVSKSKDKLETLWKRGFRFVVLDTIAYEKLRSIIKVARGDSSYILTPLINTNEIEIFRLDASKMDVGKPHIRCHKTGIDSWDIAEK